MDKILISVIVPVYNVEKYLKRCIDSILSQTLKNIEIILINDGSPDNCKTICEDYEKAHKNIRVINQENKGLGLARNEGIKIAKGEYIAFVDSDDYIESKMYEDLYELCSKNNLDSVFSGYKRLNSKGRITIKSETSNFQIFEKDQITGFLAQIIGPYPSNKSDVKYAMSVWRSLYKSEIIKKNNIKFYSEREFGSEDILFQVDYLKHSKKTGIYPETYYVYCENEESLTTKYNKNKFNSYIKLFSKIETEVSSMNYNFDDHINRLKFLYLRIIIRDEILCKSKHFKDKINYISSMILHPDILKMTKNYPYKKLPLAHRSLFAAIKHRNIFLVYLIIFLETKIK